MDMTADEMVWWYETVTDAAKRAKADKGES